MSTRMVARSLGVTAKALYHHFESRVALLEAMADEVLGEALVPEPELAAARAQGWRAAVGCVARQTWEALQAHPWVLRGHGGARLGANGLRHAEQLLSALAQTGLEGRERAEAMHLVDEYVLGNVVRALGAGLGESDREAASPLYQRWLRRQLSAREHPRLVALLGATRCGLPEAWARTFPEGPDQLRFERGLAVLLDGLTVRAGAEVPAPAAGRGAPRGAPRGAGRAVDAEAGAVSRP